MGVAPKGKIKWKLFRVWETHKMMKLFLIKKVLAILKNTIWNKIDSRNKSKREKKIAPELYNVISFFLMVKIYMCLKRYKAGVAL